MICEYNVNEIYGNVLMNQLIKQRSGEADNDNIVDNAGYEGDYKRIQPKRHCKTLSKGRPLLIELLIISLPRLSSFRC